MTAPRTSVHPLYLRVAPPDIALIKFLFESYEGVGIVRTLDRHAAILVVLVVPDLLPAAREIVRALAAETGCTEVAAPPLDSEDWLMREIEDDA